MKRGGGGGRTVCRRQNGERGAPHDRKGSEVIAPPYPAPDPTSVHVPGEIPAARPTVVRGGGWGAGRGGGDEGTSTGARRDDVTRERSGVRGGDYRGGGATGTSGDDERGGIKVARASVVLPPCCCGGGGNKCATG